MNASWGPSVSRLGWKQADTEQSTGVKRLGLPFAKFLDIRPGAVQVLPRPPTACHCAKPWASVS